MTGLEQANGALLDASRAKLFLVASILVTFALYVIPYGWYLAYPLMLLSTLAHEMGHGLAAVLVGAEFEQFQMWPDGSGVATWRGQPGRLARAWIAAGGLIGPAVASGFCFALARRGWVARVTLGVFAAAMGVAIVLVVRNLFALIFVAVVAAGLGAVAFKARPWAAQLTLLFVGTQLALSVFSRSDYLFTDVAETSGGTMPSDVAQMSQQLFLPYWFWGAICGLFSLGVMAVGLWLFFRDADGPTSPES